MGKEFLILEGPIGGPGLADVLRIKRRVFTAILGKLNPWEW
jgi:hypothetical protein